MGRRSKLDANVQAKIVEAVGTGNYLDVSARYAGITPATLHSWMKRGRDELERVENGAKSNEKETVYVEFLDAVEKARAVSETSAVALIRRAAVNGTWQAAAWYLERSNHERWGRKQAVELTGRDGGPLQVENLTPDEANQRLVDYLDGLAEKRRDE
jgi:hypothetical protein